MSTGSRTIDDLVARIRAGDRAACDELVRREYSAVYRFLLHLARDVEVAADLTQDTFRTAWEKLPQFQGDSTVASWLHRIAYNKFADTARRRQLDRTWQESQADRPPAPETPSPADVACDSESSARLYQAVTQLPQDQRIIIVLHYFQSLSLRETAEVLGEPIGTVKWRASAALSALRTTFAVEPT